MNLKNKREEIIKDVFILYEKMFPLYLIRGNRNYLIDCSISPYSQRVVDGIKSILTEEKPDVLLTHSHYDHTGACPLISEIFNPEIYGSKRTVELLRMEKVIKYIERLNRKFESILNLKTNLEFKPFKNLNPVKENDRIVVDNKRYFTVFETPGHTKCSLSYLLEPQGILFPGDAAGVMERKGKIKPLFLSSYSSYVSSLKKLIKLDAEIVALPHNRYIKGKERVRKFLSSSLEQTKKTGELIRKALLSGKEPGTVAEKILASEFPQPTVQGPGEAFTINLNAMVNAVKNELY